MSDRKHTELQPGKIDPLFKWQWCEALRSGRYKQCRDTLRQLDRSGDIAAYCCIGVGADVAGLAVRGLNTTTALDRTGIGYANGTLLITLNDGGRTFPEIADWIEDNL